MRILNTERAKNGYTFNDLLVYYFILIALNVYVFYAVITFGSFSVENISLQPILGPIGLALLALNLYFFAVFLLLNAYYYWKRFGSISLKQNDLSRIKELLDNYRDGIPISIDRMSQELRMKSDIVIVYLKEILQYNKGIGELYELEGTFIKNSKDLSLIDDLIKKYDQQSSLKV